MIMNELLLDLILPIMAAIGGFITGRMKWNTKREDDITDLHIEISRLNNRIVAQQQVIKKMMQQIVDAKELEQTKQ